MNTTEVYTTSYVTSKVNTNTSDVINVTNVDTNNTFTTSSREDSSLTRIILLSIIFSLMSITILFGNVLVLLAGAWLPKPRRAARLLVINLAVADISLGVLTVPLTSYNELVSWPFGEKWCVVYTVTDTLLCTCSLFTLCAMAIDRYIGVTRPLRYNVIMTDRTVGAMLVVTWVLAWSVSCPPLFGWRQEAPDDPTICFITTHAYYIIESAICGFFLPCIVVTCLYTKIYIVARKNILEISKTIIPQNNDISAESGDGNSDTTTESNLSSAVSASFNISIVALPDASQRQTYQNDAAYLQKVAKIKMEIRAAKTFGKVLGAFMICWLPFVLVYPFGKSKHKTCVL